MKVLHLINTLSAGGAELHLLTLCRYLKQWGVDVVVGYFKEVKGSRPLRRDFEASGVRVVDLDGARIWDGRYLLRVRKLILQERPDILHTHLPRADLLGFLIRLVKPSIPWVCSVHGIYATHWSGRQLLPLFYFAWGRSDRIIAISKAVKQWLVQEQRLQEWKVEVVHYGIEPGRYAKPSEDLRSRWGFNKHFIIGSIGRLEPIKGHDLLIRSMPTVLQTIPQAMLLIAGHDPWGYGRELKGLINELGLGDRVRLMGFQNDVSSFLHALDVFAFASRSEGFGQVVIEAMAAGKPVIVPQIAPLTEIVVNGETGICVEPENPKALAEAIVRLLSHPDERRRMGERGIQWVHERFSAKRMAQKMLGLYRMLVNVK